MTDITGTDLPCPLASTGTAGLRAKMGPGFNRMNPVTIQQTTQGLAKYLQQQAPQQLMQNGVIIGKHRQQQQQQQQQQHWPAVACCGNEPYCSTHQSAPVHLN